MSATGIFKLIETLRVSEYNSASVGIQH